MFVNSETLIPVAPIRKLNTLQRRWELWPQTYRDIVDELTAKGISFSKWRAEFSEIAEPKLEEYWTKYWHLKEAQTPDGPKKPGHFSELVGDSVLPNDVDSGEDNTLVGDPRMMLFDEMNFDQRLVWAELVWLWSDIAVVDAKLRMCMGAWALGGMFQIAVCLTLLNCFNNDERGRPKGS